MVRQTDHVVAAAVLQAEPDVALVVDGGRVGKLVRLELDRGPRPLAVVLERAHQLLVHRTASVVEEQLVGPAEAVADRTIGDLHAEDVLPVQGHHQRQTVADLHVLGRHVLLGVAGVDVHRRARQRHGHRRRQLRPARYAASTKSKSVLAPHRLLHSVTRGCSLQRGAALSFWGVTTPKKPLSSEAITPTVYCLTSVSFLMPSFIVPQLEATVFNEEPPFLFGGSLPQKATLKGSNYPRGPLINYPPGVIYPQTFYDVSTSFTRWQLTMKGEFQLFFHR